MEPTAAKADIADALPSVEVLEETSTGSRWATFHRIRYRFRGRAGSWITQEREFLDRGDSVALLPFCPENGHILLTRQFRMPVYLRHPQDAMLLEVCGGILDHANPEVTLRHEALDELGVELHEVEHVFSAFSTPGSVCEKIHFYIAHYSAAQRRTEGGGLQHEGEDIEVLEIPLAEALPMLRSGQIQDARTVSLVLYLIAQQALAAGGETSEASAT